MATTASGQWHTTGADKAVYVANKSVTVVYFDKDEDGRTASYRNDADQIAGISATARSRATLRNQSRGANRQSRPDA